MVSFTPQLLHPCRQNPHYPLDRRQVGPQSWLGRGGKEKFPAHAGNQTPVVQPIAYWLY